jgi:hypothetical protein
MEDAHDRNLLAQRCACSQLGRRRSVEPKQAIADDRFGLAPMGHDQKFFWQLLLDVQAMPPLELLAIRAVQAPVGERLQTETQGLQPSGRIANGDEMLPGLCRIATLAGRNRPVPAADGGRDVCPGRSG